MRIVAGRLRGRRLRTVAGNAVRPTGERAREALFAMLEHGEPPLRGARFLDLFAGSGAIGLEAVSRGAALVVMVEHASAALAVCRANVEALGVAAQAALLRRDAARLGRAPQPFDIAVLDPPYGQGLTAPALAGLVAGGWLAPGALAVAEVAAAERLAAPAGLALVDERRYGAARLVFLRADGVRSTVGQEPEVG